MAKGATAKKRVIEKIQEAFGNDYILVDGSKIYVWADDGGEKVQIAMALTCPKVMVGDGVPPKGTPAGNVISFEEPQKPAEPVKISEQEAKNIETLMQKLGL